MFQISTTNILDFTYLYLHITGKEGIIIKASVRNVRVSVVCTKSFA